MECLRYGVVCMPFPLAAEEWGSQTHTPVSSFSGSSEADQPRRIKGDGLSRYVRVPTTVNAQHSHLFVMTEYLITTVPDRRYLGFGPYEFPRDPHRIPPPPRPIIILPKGTEAGKVGCASSCTLDSLC